MAHGDLLFAKIPIIFSLLISFADWNFMSGLQGAGCGVSW
jgi:hypothetical protein